MSATERRALIIGGVVALIVLGLLLPLKGRVTYRHDLKWVPPEDDPKVVAIFTKGEVEVREVDQVYPLQILVEKEGYSAFFYTKVRGDNAVAVWLVRVPDEEVILKHEEEVFPRLGLRVKAVSNEGRMLIATTEFDGAELLLVGFLAALLGILAAAFTL